MVGLAIVSGYGTSEGRAMSQNPRSTDQPRPRDGGVAVQQELDAARVAGTVEAYDLFLSRHAGHPLADVARRELAEIARRRSR